MMPITKSIKVIAEVIAEVIADEHSMDIYYTNLDIWKEFNKSNSKLVSRLDSII
jgi:hypothetical protein